MQSGNISLRQKRHLRRPKVTWVARWEYFEGIRIPDFEKLVKGARSEHSSIDRPPSHSCNCEFMSLVSKLLETQSGVRQWNSGQCVNYGCFLVETFCLQIPDIDNRVCSARKEAIRQRKVDPREYYRSLICSTLTALTAPKCRFFSVLREESRKDRNTLSVWAWWKALGGTDPISRFSK